MKIKTLLKAALLVGLIGIIIILVQYSKIEYTGKAVYESGKIDVYFCPEERCNEKIAEQINKATRSVYCAIYSVNDNEIIKALKEKDVEKGLVTDKNNKEEISGIKTVKNYGTNQLMHNKFCVVDHYTVITGSYNPTKSEANNTNNLLIIRSKYLAENYEEEFKEVYNKQFGEGVKVKNPVIYLNSRRVENYFCPEDECSKKLLKELKGANKSITFFTFSFTDKDIAQELIKKHNEGIKVEGLLEKTQKSDYDQFDELKDAGINVGWYEKKYKLHDKVFVIDEKIVITGSYNPTENADKRNDENIIIIEDSSIAKKYVERFKTLSS
ncbi:MAG: phospholipase D-like domain-containing protein [Candidatus Nanoarchaeia archaeon]